MIACCHPLLVVCRQFAQQVQRQLQAAQAAVSEAEAAKLKLEQELHIQEFTVQVRFSAESLSSWQQACVNKSVTSQALYRQPAANTDVSVFTAS